MKQYLVQRTGEDPLGMAGAGILPPVMQGYLTTTYFVAHPEGAVGLRTAREMRTLAMISDLVCSGRPLSALDVIAQRQKALEVSIEQGGWNQARWFELIPTTEVSSWSRDDLRDAMKEQELEARLGLGAAGRRRSPERRRSRSRQQRDPRARGQRNQNPQWMRNGGGDRNKPRGQEQRAPPRRSPERPQEKK